MAKVKKHVVMVAAENGALIGGKAGGVADVIRDLPKALAAKGIRVTVVTPSYGFLHETNPVLSESQVEFRFCNRPDTASVFVVQATEPVKGVENVVIENARVRGNPIYIHDDGWRPFASDASKYALFCSAVGRLLLTEGSPLFGADLIHAHDWHTGTLFVLRDLHPDFAGLQSMRTVFTIHNLGIQGSRPLQGEESSLAAWFPELFLDPSVAPLIFERYADYRYQMPCYTPLAAGISGADIVTTVSPTYAKEIVGPSNHAQGVWGGEGLENLLQSVADEGRLVGILNAIEYPEDRKAPKMAFAKLREALEKTVGEWSESAPDHDGHRKALERLTAWKGRKVKAVVTMVARLADQKVRLFLDRGHDGATGMETVARVINEAGGVLIVLGTGSHEFERPFAWAMEANENILFLQRHDETVADILYASGHLFLMPSLYEPCGLAQMLAMRDGQPPVAHGVGGLLDTVQDGKNGFVFDGDNPGDKVDAFAAAVERALGVFSRRKKAWGEIRTEAANSRFLWTDAAKDYVKLVYGY